MFWLWHWTAVCTYGMLVPVASCSWLRMEQPGDYISSVAWIKEGNYLAVGTSNAEVQVSLVACIVALWSLGSGGSLPTLHL